MSAEARRREYLKALGIDVYTLRGEAQATDAARLDDLPGGPTPDWETLRRNVAKCTGCSLHQSRTQTVFGTGNPTANWMIVGEAPGHEEDQRGEPFVGRAGKLLDEMLKSIGLDRDSVFIANLLKCRPPGNRDPSAHEAAACRHYLDRQIELVAPKIVLAVGRIAAQHLLNSDVPVGRMRGKKHYLNDGQLPVVVTYHPAYLLRSPTQKRKAWQDLVLARQLMKELTQ